MLLTPTSSSKAARRRRVTRAGARGLVTELARDQRGATMVEYVILVGVVAIAAMSAFKTFGSQVRAKIDQQADTVSIIQGS
jgi:Flp pilus assembly pilin Flp